MRLRLPITKDCSVMAVYGDIAEAVEIGMAVVIVGAFFLFFLTLLIDDSYRPHELRVEIVIIAAGLIVPLAILQTIFEGLYDWSQGHTDIVGVVVLPLILVWLSFVFWTTLTPSAFALIGIRLGLIKGKGDPLEENGALHYFLSWDKLFRNYFEFTKWGALLVLLFLIVYLPIYSPPEDKPGVYITLCFPLFFVILLFSQDRSKIG